MTKPTTYNISGQVLLYAMLCTLLLAVVLCLSMGWLAWGSTRDATRLQAELHQARDDARTCRIALERMDAKMELVDAWVLGAKKIRDESAGGGP